MIVTSCHSEATAMNYCGDRSNIPDCTDAVVQNVGIVVYMFYRMFRTVAVILGFIACPTAQRLTCITTAMLDNATTSDVGRAERTGLDGIAGLILALLDHELDNLHIDVGSEVIVQLLLGRLS